MVMSQSAMAVMTQQDGGLLSHRDKVAIAPDATLEPFYLARSAQTEGEAFHHLGFTAHSKLPERDLSAWLEVSAVATPQSSHRFEPAAHRLTRLGLRDRVDDVDLTVRYYSIGDAVAANPLALGRLRSLGLPSAGEGAQLSASWSGFGIDVLPEAHWQRQAGEQSQALDSVGVKLRRRIGDLGLLNWQLNARSQSRGSGNDEVTIHKDASSVSLDASTWRVYWSGLLESEQDRTAGADISRTTQELGGVFRFWEDFEVAPQYRVTQTSAADATIDRVAGMRFSGRWPSTPKFSLNLQLRERLGADLEEQIYSARLAAQRRMRLTEDAPESLLLTTSLSYQNRTGVETRPADGLSFELSLELKLTGS